MRLALVVPRPPLPFGSSDGRWFHVLTSELPRLGVKLRVLAFHEGPDADAASAQEHSKRWGYELTVIRPSVSTDAVSRLNRLWRPRTELVRDSPIRQYIGDLSSWSDEVVFSGIVVPGLSAGLVRATTEIHYLRSVDQRGELRRSVRTGLRMLQDRRAEAAHLATAGELIVNSERMARLVAEAPGGRRPKAITPLTVDPMLYRPSLDRRPKPVVGFIGSMFWEPSRRAAERLLVKIWPRIIELVPEAQLLVAGWNAAEYLGQYFPCPGARLVTDIATTEEFFRSISILVFPPVGGTGIKIKTLEAMASGIPVVTTAEGIEGLEDVLGAPTPVVDNDSALAQVTSELLRSPTSWRLRREAALDAFSGPLAPTTVARRFLEAVVERTA